ncbi:hypothetical protein ACTXT7_000647 [Hymenolepis weldensis]
MQLLYINFCLASPVNVQRDFLLPRLQEHLNMEREERVRCELVAAAVGLLPALSAAANAVASSEDTSTPQMTPLLALVRPILAFLNHNSDQPKQYVFEYFGQLMSFIPASEIQLTILPSLVNLWQGKNWRVRLGVVQSLPYLFATLISLAVINRIADVSVSSVASVIPESCLRETILPSTLAWLIDPTWAVRDCACRSLARLLSACPAAATDAIMGTAANSPGSNDKDATIVATSTSNTPASTVAANASGEKTSSSSGGPEAAAGAGGDTGAPLSIAAMAANASARGLRALATEQNYHLRQIFILAVQALWGPGIPMEPTYSALGDSSPSAGLISPAALYDYVLSTAHDQHGKKVSSSAKKSPGATPPLPEGCEPSPGPRLPPTAIATCLSLLLQLLTDDPVANVRFAAARTLVIISGAIDGKSVQKQVIPALKKVLEDEKDADVRFFAQDALKLSEINNKLLELNGLTTTTTTTTHETTLLLSSLATTRTKPITAARSNQPLGDQLAKRRKKTQRAKQARNLRANAR